MSQKDSSKGIPPTDQASFVAQDPPGIEVLKKCLSENVAEGQEVLGLFKSFYGEQEAKSLFDQVKSGHSRFLEDERPAFKRLANLERDRLRLENELNLAKKRYRYSSMSLEELAELVVKIEDQHLRNGLDFQQQGINLRGKQLFLLGGLNYTSQGQAVASGRAVSIDLDSMEVTPLPDLPTARSNASSTCIGPQVYVVGGSSDRGMTQAFEVYDTRSRRWEVLDNIPEELSGVQACTHQHNLVVWGKNKSQKPAIFMYETVRRKWGVIPSPPVMLPDHHDSSVFFKTCSQPQLGYAGSHLLSFERRGSQTALALYGLNDADPSWKKVDPCNKMQTIHQTLRQSHPDSQFKFLSAGTQTAIQSVLLGQGSSCTWIYDVLSGFRSKISDLEGHRLLAFAESVAVFRIDLKGQHPAGVFSAGTAAACVPESFPAVAVDKPSSDAEMLAGSILEPSAVADAGIETPQAKPGDFSTDSASAPGKSDGFGSAGATAAKDAPQAKATPAPPMSSFTPFGGAAKPSGGAAMPFGAGAKEAPQAQAPVPSSEMEKAKPFPSFGSSGTQKFSFASPAAAPASGFSFAKAGGEAALPVPPPTFSFSAPVPAPAKQPGGFSSFSAGAIKRSTPASLLAPVDERTMSMCIYIPLTQEQRYFNLECNNSENEATLACYEGFSPVIIDMEVAVQEAGLSNAGDDV